MTRNCSATGGLKGRSFCTTPCARWRLTRKSRCKPSGSIWTQNPATLPVTLPEGSWGEGGFHYIWLNEQTAWSWKLVYEVEAEMSALAREYGDNAAAEPILKQAAREALLLMASDWQFCISTGGAKDYSEVRLRNHYDNFQALAGLTRRPASGKELSVGDWKNIAECEARDSVFPDIEPNGLRRGESGGVRRHNYLSNPATQLKSRKNGNEQANTVVNRSPKEISPMKAVVMAGGEGTRLRPLTSSRPKPLVPILNKPCMQHTIELLKRYGVTDIVVTLYYLADEIEGYFGDGSELGVNLIYTVEDTPLGTAGSVKKAEEYLKDDTFIIVSGDALTDMDVDKALAFHREKESVATLVLQHVDNPLEFGVVITDDNGRIRRFLEKPSWGEVFSDTVNTGMYILEPSIFEYMQPEKNYDWSQDIFPQILKEEKPMFGYVMGEYWTDVGSLQQYRQAQYEMLGGMTKLPIEGAPQGGHIWIGEGTEIDPSAQIVGPVCIGKNCRIKADAHIGPDTVIGDNCLIEEGATLAAGDCLGLQLHRRAFAAHGLYGLLQKHDQRTM